MQVPEHRGTFTWNVPKRPGRYCKLVPHTYGPNGQGSGVSASLCCQCVGSWEGPLAASWPFSSVSSTCVLPRWKHSKTLDHQSSMVTVFWRTLKVTRPNLVLHSMMLRWCARATFGRNSPCCRPVSQNSLWHFGSLIVHLQTRGFCTVATTHVVIGLMKGRWIPHVSSQLHHPMRSIL